MSNSEDLRPVACEPAPVAIADWDDLLHAVKARLRLIVGERMTPLQESPQDGPQHDAMLRLQADVLECVSALDQLHLTLSHDLTQRSRRERPAQPISAIRTAPAVTAISSPLTGSSRT